MNLPSAFQSKESGDGVRPPPKIATTIGGVDIDFIVFI